MTVPTPSPGAPALATHRLFERRARERPRDPAVIGGGAGPGGSGAGLDYGELDARAAALARRLTAAGVGPGTPVAVTSPRSAGHVVATLAVWKAGGVCVPVDPLLAPERRARLLALSGARLAVGPEERVTRAGEAGPTDAGPADARSTGAGSTGAGPRAREAATPEAGGTRWAPRSEEPERIAYVFFTSGSSGEPKAVGVPHSGIVNEALWTREAFGLGPGAVGSWLSSPGFAITRWELWSPLTSGAAVACADEGTEWDAAEVRRFLLAEGVTWSVAVTRLGERLMALDWPAGTPLLALVTGGEQLRTWPRKLPFRVHNSYGITETSGVRLVAPLPRTPPEDGAGSLPPIGAPIRGTHAYVLDGAQAPVAEGTAGELYIGGLGLAHGYLGGPGMTAARFVPDPFQGAGQRMYRTGDLVLRSADGLLRYVGRADDEVKIRGVRISPAEIESALLAHASVASAVVRADAAGGVVCYLVSAKGPAPAVTAHGLRAFLTRRLPSIAAALTFVELPELPLLTSGKTDRAALPDPRPGNVLTDAYDAPRDGLEATVAAAFRDVLGTPKVSRHDDFFALGGDSLQLARMKSALESALSLTLPASALFTERTPHQLAALLATLPGPGEGRAARTDRPAGAPEAPEAEDTDTPAAWIDGLSDDEVADLLAVLERTEET